MSTVEPSREAFDGVGDIFYLFDLSTKGLSIQRAALYHESS